MNCGVRLPGAAEAEVVAEVARIDGLEVTALDEGSAEVPGERVAELEPTMREDAGAAVFMAAIPELEATKIDDPLAAMITAEMMPEFDPTSEKFERETSGETPANAPCVYCQHVQESGRTCDNCGRLRTRVIVAPTADAQVVEVEIVDGLERCRSCGGRVRPAPLCSECGRPLPVAEV